MAARPIAATQLPPAATGSSFEALVGVTKAVADEYRAGVLRVLKDESFGVLELCRILDTAQPALSHHLKVLFRAGLVAKRREGNAVFYRRAPVRSDLHGALLAAIDAIPMRSADQRRLEAVHADRSRTSEAFFTANAQAFAANQARICEAAVYAGSVVEAVNRLGLGSGTALEVGPGNGELLCRLAGRFARVVGVDNSAEMLERCAARTGAQANVTLVHSDLAGLPAQPRYQLAVAAMVLHHQPSPQRFFHHARGLLAADGVLVVAELCRHDHEWARTACGDLWLGFEPEELAEWAANAGFAAGESEYLAQKNGFRVQIHTYHNRPSD